MPKRVYTIRMETLRIILVLISAFVAVVLALRTCGGTFRALCDFGLGGAASGAVGLCLYLYIPVAGQPSMDDAPAIFTILFFGAPAGLLAAVTCAVLCGHLPFSRVDRSKQSSATEVSLWAAGACAGALWLYQAIGSDAGMVAPGAIAGGLFGTALGLFLWTKQRRINCSQD